MATINPPPSKPIRVDRNQVAAFVKVVDAGSFTAAATTLEQPKSSVSRAVATLEETLGVRLLQRTTRKLSLTEAGRTYYQQVRAAVSSLDDASTTAADASDDPRGVVRITMPPDLDGMLSSVLARFVTRYPHIHLALTVTGRRVDLIAEGFDLALRGGTDLEDSTLVARKIATSAFVLFAAPAYLKRRGTPKKLADLAGHDCVLFRSSQGLMPWRLQGPRGLEQVAVAGPITVDDLPTAIQLARAGVGIGLLPEAGVVADLTRGTLVRVLPAYALGGASMYVVSPPLRHVPARVTLVRDFLIAELTKLFAGCGSRRRH